MRWMISLLGMPPSNIIENIRNRILGRTLRKGCAFLRLRAPAPAPMLAQTERHRHGSSALLPTVKAKLLPGLAQPAYGRPVMPLRILALPMLVVGFLLLPFVT